jgi:hypothetical protein
VRCEDVPVEIQVRTALQNGWAQAFERLGDEWGREIRYGEPLRDPKAPAVVMPGTRQDAVVRMLELSEAIARFEDTDCRLQELELRFSPRRADASSGDDILENEEDERHDLVAEVLNEQRSILAQIQRYLQGMESGHESEA